LDDILTYESYLKLDELLSIQELLTNERTELMFIVAHQTSELWFKVLIHELNFSNSSVLSRINLKRIVKIFEHLNTLWDIIATMTPRDYERFRTTLGTASGKQSDQYIEVERLLKELPNKCYNKEGLCDVENAFKKWQFSHMKAVERIIGDKPGTGGTSGVQYLKLAVDKRLFDE
jgi:tryptophan 2,3-dioxygenase